MGDRRGQPGSPGGEAREGTFASLEMCPRDGQGPSQGASPLGFRGFGCVCKNGKVANALALFHFKTPGRGDQPGPRHTLCGPRTLSAPLWSPCTRTQDSAVAPLALNHNLAARLKSGSKDSSPDDVKRLFASQPAARTWRPWGSTVRQERACGRTKRLSSSPSSGSSGWGTWSKSLAL